MVMVLKLSAPRAPAKPPATSFPPVQNRKQALSDRDSPPGSHCPEATRNPDGQPFPSARRNCRQTM